MIVRTPTNSIKALKAKEQTAGINRFASKQRTVLGSSLERPFLVALVRAETREMKRRV